MTSTIPHSPYVSSLIQRTADYPANDFFPSAYIHDGPELERALASLRLELVEPAPEPNPPRLTLARLGCWTLSLLFGALVLIVEAVSMAALGGGR